MLGLISAHGLAGPPGTPVRGAGYAVGAALVLLAAFAVLGARWKAPRLQRDGIRAERQLPPVVEIVCGLAGIGLFAWLVARGFTGSQDPNDNDLSSFVYVSLVGLVFVCVALGDVFAPFNPWRAFARAAGWAERRLRGDRLGKPLAYPAWLGHWPAAATLAALAWLELASGNPAGPTTLAVVALVYAAVQLLGMALFGVDPWTRRGDGLAVAFGLFGRLGVKRLPGTAALLFVVLGAAAFDGLSSTTQWAGLVPDLHDTLGSVELGATAGLLVTILLAGAIYGVGVAGVRLVAPEHRPAGLGGEFVTALIPVAAGLLLAHYVTFLAGHVFDTQIDKTVTWMIQVAVLVAGAVGGLVMAHDRALALFPDARRARRAQQWMLAVMAGYAGLGLWLLTSLSR